MTYVFIKEVILLAFSGSILVQSFLQTASTLSKPHSLKLNAITSRDELLGYLFYGDKSKETTKWSFTDLNYLGYGEVAVNGIRRKCLFLSKDSPKVGYKEAHSVDAIPVPLPESISEEFRRLLVQDEIRETVSMARLRLSTCIVNRDNALFDNLPWAEWTVDDPQSLDRDAWGKTVDSKYHMGKRMAYNRLTGGYWNACGNDSSQVLYQLTTLQDKLMELEVKEARMKVADAEESLAIHRTVKKNGQDSNIYDAVTIDMDIEMASRTLEDAQLHLSKLERELQSRIRWVQIQSILTPFVNKFLSTFPFLKNKKEGSYNNQLSAESTSTIEPNPYVVLHDIIRNQLNADIMACVLENTSIFKGTIQLAGAVVLSRRGQNKSIRVDGKVISFEDSDDDFGNKGVPRGSVLIIDCDVDEAIAIAKFNGISLLVDSNTCDDLKIRVSVVTIDNSSTQIQVLDPKINWDVPGKQNESSDIAASLSSIDSLETYDLLTNEDKARLLMANLVRLPRSRMLKNVSHERKQRNPLDDLCLPLLDETVRRSFLIREAGERGDTIEIERLRRDMSERQKLKELSRRARIEDNSEEADALDEMADQLGKISPITWIRHRCYWPI